MDFESLKNEITILRNEVRGLKVEGESPKFTSDQDPLIVFLASIAHKVLHSNQYITDHKIWEIGFFESDPSYCDGRFIGCKKIGEISINKDLVCMFDHDPAIVAFEVAKAIARVTDLRRGYKKICLIAFEMVEKAGYDLKKALDKYKPGQNSWYINKYKKVVLNNIKDNLNGMWDNEVIEDEGGKMLKKDYDYVICFTPNGFKETYQYDPSNMKFDLDRFHVCSNESKFDKYSSRYFLDPIHNKAFVIMALSFCLAFYFVSPNPKEDTTGQKILNISMLLLSILIYPIYYCAEFSRQERIETGVCSFKIIFNWNYHFKKKKKKTKKQ